jgi:hypothetical protein
MAQIVPAQIGKFLVADRIAEAWMIPRPVSTDSTWSPARRTIDLPAEFTRAARDGEGRGEGDRSGSSEGPKRSASTKPQAPRPRKRYKDRDQDNER